MSYAYAAQRYPAGGLSIGALYVVDTDNAHDDGVSGGGHADYVTDDLGTIFSASATTSQRPSINTTDIPGHKTLHIGSGQQALELVSAPLAAALEAGADFTWLCRCRLGTLSAVLELMSHSFSSSPIFSGHGSSSFMYWSSTFSTASGSWLIERNGGTQDTNQINHSRDATTFHTMGLTSQNVSGTRTLYCYKDGVSVGSATRGADFPASGNLNQIVLGSQNSPTANTFKLWAGYATAFTAAQHLAAHNACLAREV